MPDDRLVVGGKTYRTVSGVLTTEVPRIELSTSRRGINTLKRVRQWLVQNAILEAQRRDDQYNASHFEFMTDRPLSPDDIELLNMYLWDAASNKQAPEEKPTENTIQQVA